jgi:hypothetical protein
MVQLDPVNNMVERQEIIRALGAQADFRIARKMPTHQ